MANITFDTLKFVRRLKDSGIPEAQAEAVAEASKEASGEAELATKQDIERLELRMDGEFRLVKWMLSATFAGRLFMDSRLVRIFCVNLPSQKARGESYNLLLLLRKDCLFCHRSECYGPPSPSISLESIKSLAGIVALILKGFF